MKRLLALGLFCVALLWGLGSYSGRGGEYTSWIVNFRNEVPTADIEEWLGAWGQRLGVQWRLNSAFAQDERVYVLEKAPMAWGQVVASLAQQSWHQRLEYMEPNYIYRAAWVPNDPDYPKQWHLRAIHAEQAWEDSRGDGAIVAVIDTGVSVLPDLPASQLVPGYDFVNDREDARDDNGHGSHVAGTIAQATNNGVGVAGVAHRAKIMPLKVLAAWGGGTVADIADAVRLAADRGAHIINLSLGGGGDSQLLKEAIAYAHRKGVLIVAAAGNEGQSSVSYPARYPHVLAVGATNATDRKAGYSNYGAGLDLVAPGGEYDPEDEERAGGVWQQTINPETGAAVLQSFQGTSMAVPHVAGVAALVRGSGITHPDDIETVLLRSVRPAGNDPDNAYGAGHLDAARAVALAQQGQLGWRDFWRWLQENGYLNPRFWWDGGLPALFPKVLMVVAAYLVAWLLRRLPFWQWGAGFHGGLWLGSSGLFWFQHLYVFDLPQAPLRWLGSALPEWASGGTWPLHPLTASVLIPLLAVVLTLGHNRYRNGAIALSLGTGVHLAIAAFWPGAANGFGETAFLLVNAGLCLGLAKLALRVPTP